MKEKRFLGTKSVIIGIISAILIGASATGVTVFLKNRDEAKATEEDQNRTLPITSWNEDGETVDEPNVTPEIVNPVETTEGEELIPKTQTPKEEQTTKSRENITRPTRQEIEEQIEETVHKRERKLYEDTKLSWFPLEIPKIPVEMGIFKPNLEIKKKASVIYQDWKKTDNLDVKVKAGDIIVYEIKVSNSGNLEAKNVTITESLPIKLIKDETELTEKKYNKLLLISAGDQLIKTNIPAKTETTFKIAYQVTQEDMDDLEKVTIANTVFAKFGRIEENDTDNSVEKEQIENYTIVKTAEIQPREDGTKPDKVEIGDKIKYTIKVKNTGTVTLKEIKIVDNKINLNETINLTVGEEKTFEEFYTIKEKDILEAIRNQQGKIFNQATGEYKEKETLTDDVPTDVKTEYEYTVRYFYDGVENTEKAETKKATYQDKIETYIDKNIVGYKLEKTENLPLIISEKSENNVINIYYKEMIKTANITEMSTTIRKTNLVLVIDMSSSMTKNRSTRLENAKKAANKFIDQIYNDEKISRINIQVITFNTKDPLKERLNYNWGDGDWNYGPNNSPFSGTNILKVAGIDDNIAKNYVEAQKLKNAISEIYIPENYKDGGYGTDIYAALTKANEQITSLKNTYKDNDNVVVFLGDGAPYRNYKHNDNKSIENISNTLQKKSTVYCIRLGNEAQDSIVFNLIASNDGDGTVIDANTEGDLIKGFKAITSSENTRKYSKDSIDGKITIEKVDLDISTEKQLKVTKSDGESVEFTSVEALNASGFITYNKEMKLITWNVKDYPKGKVLKISYHIK